MRSVTSALSAKLFELEAIRRLLLVLRRDVIPVLALGALKRDVISWHNSSIHLGVRQTSVCRVVLTAVTATDSSRSNNICHTLLFDNF